MNAAAGMLNTHPPQSQLSTDALDVPFQKSEQVMIGLEFCGELHSAEQTTSWQKMPESSLEPASQNQ
ncbi:MAG: hypothetical protein KDI36_12160 [Pseudomonadales bacterium]|nr:hypothetical protein [Pseudomonadales bacterium]